METDRLDPPRSDLGANGRGLSRLPESEGASALPAAEVKERGAHGRREPIGPHDEDPRVVGVPSGEIHQRAVSWRIVRVHQGPRSPRSTEQAPRRVVTPPHPLGAPSIRPYLSLSFL